VHKESTLLASIASLKLALSDQNLELLPDYEQRIGVLKELRFIDENQTVQLKGRVACEVRFLNLSYWAQKITPPVLNLTDKLNLGINPHRTHLGEHTRVIHTRRSSGALVLVCFPRKDGQRTEADAYARTRAGRDYGDRRARREGTRPMGSRRLLERGWEE